MTMQAQIKQHFAGRNLPKEILLDCIGSLFFAIGIYYFAKNADFAPGGITGVALIINYFFPWAKIGLVTNLLNIPLILLSYRYLGGSYLIRTARTLIISMIFMDYIVPLFGAYNGQPFVGSIYSGFFSGLGLAIIYNNKTCTGGSDLLIMTARKIKPQLSIGQITMIIDGSVVLAGWAVFGNLEAVLNGFVYTAVTTIVIDKVMYGFVSGKLAMIVSDQASTIAKEISAQLQRGSTRIMARGTYQDTDKDMLICACSRTQQVRVNEIVRKIDPAAFLIILEYNEVRGQGFLPHNEQI